MAESLWKRISGLSLQIDGFELERLELAVGPEFTRVTTVIQLRGGGEEGVGEEVTYDPVDQELFQQEGPKLPLAGSWTLESFSAHLDELTLFTREPAQQAYRDYRRWALESAALDLALRQAGMSLARALEREPQPLTFVASMRLPDPPSLDPLERWLGLYPGLRFKLDPTSAWDDAFVDAVAGLGKVDVADLKGAYKGTPVDQPPDPALYERIAERLPEALIEDPALTAETEPVLERHHDRITWDAPIHSVGDVLALPFTPSVLNVKPSRFGPLRRLFAFYEWCAENGVRNYGGGQFELGPGRGQIQYLASLFHADGSNDVAPSGFNAGLQAGLPTSPLPPPDAAAPGFRA